MTVINIRERNNDYHMIIRLTKQITDLQKIKIYLGDREEEWRKDDEVSLNLMAEIASLDEIIVGKIDLISTHRENVQ